jgi:hypothetical protein
MEQYLSAFAISTPASDAWLYHVRAVFWRLLRQWLRCLLMGEDSAQQYVGDPWRLHFSRIGVGLVAGLVVALVKAAADNTDFTASMLDSSFLNLMLKVLGYSLVPMILGAVGGWISDEQRVHKIFWVAISGPVIIAAAASGWSAAKAPQVLPVGKAGWNLEQLLPITSAYADEVAPKYMQAVPSGSSPVQQQPVTQTTSPFVSGLNAFLGGRQDNNRYRVVVASINDYDKAVATAARLNSMKVLPAPVAVGERKVGNEYFPVIVDGWLNLSDAKQLRDKVSSLDLGLPDPPYVSIRDY